MDPQLITAVERIIAQPVATLEPVRGGGNSRVFLATSRSGARFAVKSYPHLDSDPRDRLGAEVAACGFLQRHELPAPRLVGSDPGLRVGVFEWIVGEPISWIDGAAIRSAGEWLTRLHRARWDPTAVRLPMAAEAVLSGAELERQLRVRFNRLNEVAADHLELAGFLGGEFTPALAQRLARARLVNSKWRLELPAALRTLSPSDFGFHNALLTARGVVFYDFEYFGWDDPVKLIADFLLHPGMVLGQRERREFLELACELYGADDPGLRTRLRSWFPLFGLRWVLIVLNEFLPERWQGRRFAGEQGERAAVCAGQLAKARALLAVGELG